MNATEEKTEKTELVGLWVGWLASPVWWLTVFEVRYAAAALATTYRTQVELALGAVGLAGSVVIAAIALASYRKAPPKSRAAFLALGGTLIAAGFAFLTLAQLVPDFFLGAST